MFGHVQPTQFDIEFSLLKVPVRVSPFFWLFSAVLGWRLQDPALIVLWIIASFFSILVHEMGHALMARVFGYEPHVVLHHMGGYASFFPDHRHTLWKSIAISLAGPFAGFGLFGISFGIETALIVKGVDISFGLSSMFGFLIFINLIWGIVNLLPVLPLDGGQVCRDVLLLFRKQDGEAWAMRIGVFVGALIAVYFLKAQMTFPAILFGLLAFTNYQALNQRNNPW